MIDGGEYDVPLENAYFQGFYEEMAGVLRSLFESALKSNPQLQQHRKGSGGARGSGSCAQRIENLIAGQSIEKQVHEDITYEDIHESEDNLWNFLLFTGYLKATGSRMEGTRQYLSLEIPNMEVKYIYENTITAWFDRKIRAADLSQFYSALENGIRRGWNRCSRKSCQNPSAFTIMRRIIIMDFWPVSFGEMANIS